MRSRSVRERGESRGDDTGKKRNETFTDVAHMDELMEQEESRESSHDPQPAEDNIRTDTLTLLH